MVMLVVDEVRERGGIVLVVVLSSSRDEVSDRVRSKRFWKYEMGAF